MKGLGDMKLTHKRDRYQRGSLTSESRKNGPDVWGYRWREATGNGQTTQRKRIIGTKKEYPTESAAWKAVDALRLDINAEAVSTSPLTIRELAEHYKAKELTEGVSKTTKTRETYEQHIEDYIVPRWGGERIADIKAFRVEDWLKSLDKADGTKSKTKAVFSVLYQHAMRYGWAERNPIKEVRQSAKPLHEPDVLTPEEVTALFSALPGYARYMVIVAAVTGLRRGELVGLKWEDIDFENGRLYVRRSLVNQVEGEPKTKGSKRPLPLETALAFALSQWKQQTSYSNPSDWVFASPYYAGRTPYWPSTVLEKIIRPTALAVEIAKRIGWHTFRRTIATLLLANGESIKTTQDLMRHATPSMTLGTYAQAVTEDKRTAQNRITSLLGLETGEASLAACA
jgi:integrase